MKKDHWENRFAKIRISEGILFFEYKPNTILDIEAAKSVVDARARLQDGKAYPIFCDIRGVIGTDKAARDYLSGSGLVLAKAVAFLILSTAPTAIVQFYLRASKPHVPVKVFTDKTAALTFLKTFRFR